MPIPGGPTIPNVPPGAFTGLFDIVGLRALPGFSIGPTGPVDPYRSVRIGGVVGPVVVGTIRPIRPVFIRFIGLVVAIGSGDSGRGAYVRARAACGVSGVAGGCIARAVARAPRGASADDALFLCFPIKTKPNYATTRSRISL